jgi:hypothetical protein
VQTSARPRASAWSVQFCAQSTMVPITTFLDLPAASSGSGTLITFRPFFIEPSSSRQRLATLPLSLLRECLSDQMNSIANLTRRSQSGTLPQWSLHNIACAAGSFSQDGPKHSGKYLVLPAHAHSAAIGGDAALQRHRMCEVLDEKLYEASRSISVRSL